MVRNIPNNDKLMEYCHMIEEQVSIFRCNCEKTMTYGVILPTNEIIWSDTSDNQSEWIVSLLAEYSITCNIINMNFGYTGIIIIGLKYSKDGQTNIDDKVIGKISELI